MRGRSRTRIDLPVSGWNDRSWQSARPYNRSCRPRVAVRPGNQQIRGALIEYLMYRESHATSIRVDLYYVINRMNNEFEGWGTAPPAAGRAEPLALQVSGHEEDGGRRVILHFSQAAQHVKVGGLDGDIKAFFYKVEFEASARRVGVFEGKFFHPECDGVLVGTSSLVSMTE